MWNVRRVLKILGIDLFGAKPDFPRGLKIGGVEVTSTAAELNRLDGINAQSAILPRTAVVSLTDLDTAGGVLAWANPTDTEIIVTDVVIDVTTKSTGASTVDIGYAANGTTSADNLIDGLDTGAGIGTYNHVDDKGENGNGRKAFKLAAGQFITGSKATGACAGLAGKAYITYHTAS